MSDGLPRKKKTSENPLYVVTNGGQDVLAASGLWDAFVKKFGLENFIEFFQMILTGLFENFDGFILLTIVQEFLDEWVSKIEKYMKLIGVLPI